MDWGLSILDKFWSLLILVSIIPSSAQELCVETKIWCEDGYCCNGGQCCIYYHETWWFWLIWGIIFMIASCCFYHRERMFRCCRPLRNRNMGTVSHPYRHIVSTTSNISANIPFYDPNVRLPSYDEVPIIPKTPPPEYNEVCCSPVLPETSLIGPNICDEIEERDWETPIGTPPPPYSPMNEQ